MIFESVVKFFFFFFFSFLSSSLFYYFFSFFYLLNTIIPIMLVPYALAGTRRKKKKETNPVHFIHNTMIISYFNPSYDCCLCISLDALHESLSPCILLVSSYFSCLFHMPFRFPLLSHYYSRMIVMRIFFF